MEQLGWLAASSPRPKMIVVQAAGCAPLVRAWEEGQPAATGADTPSVAAALRVPKPQAGRTILAILRQSSGAAVAVTDSEIMDAMQHWARAEGLFAAPEGAAALAGYRKLIGRGLLSPEEKVVLFSTGAGFKYIDTIAAWHKPGQAVPASRNLGGIIQPY
jgi:threonine synthase